MHLYPLKTIDQLYTPKFNYKSATNKLGDYTTTIIDKKTQKPVEIAVRQSLISGDYESYGLYKIDELSGDEILLGVREFGIGKDHIKSGIMHSFLNDQYAGIGIREHQIAIERMLQCNFNNIVISSIPSSYSFHYKCGFRPIKNKDVQTFSYKELNQLIQNIAKKYGLNEAEAKNLSIYKEKEGYVIFDFNATYGSITKFLISKCKEIPKNAENVFMHLESKQLTQWIKRIKKQPIFPNK